MQHIRLNDMRQFNDLGMKRTLVHDCADFRMLNFNFKAGQELPIHSHDADGTLSIVVLEGSGWFLGADNATIEAQAGDVLVSAIREPHGIRAATEMRVVVSICPPI
ncbi:MAG: cupin domain-containing protein [Desulfovibrionaceae bacterium]